MTFRAVATGLLVLIVSLATLVWVNRSKEIARQRELKENPPDMGTPEQHEAFKQYRLKGAPELSSQGPHPKAVVPENLYAFGRISVGEQQSRKFTIRNEGEAVLKLAAGRASCDCSSVVIPDSEVPPGGSTEVEMLYRGERFTDDYMQTVHVLTNDPENRDISLTASGKCAIRVSVSPGYTWHFGEITGKEPIVIQGHIASPLVDTFKILGIESSSPFLKVEFSEMTPEEVAATNCPTAYRLTAQLSPDFPAGKFHAHFVVRTDMEEGPGTPGTAMSIQVDASKQGPFRTLAASNGCRWFSETRRLDLGQFNASEGKSTIIPLLIEDRDGQLLEFSDIQSDGKHVQFRLEPVTGADANVGGRRRYNLVFEVPPGSPVESHELSNPVTIRAKTNHPEVPEIEFFVLYISG